MVKNTSFAEAASSPLARRAKDFLVSLLWPSSKKGSALSYVGFWMLAFPLTSALFPRAEEVLKKEGLDPAIAQELAPGKNIYIRTGDNLAGKIHTALVGGPLLAPIVYFTTMQTSHSINGMLSLGFLDALKIPRLPVDFPICRIYMQPRESSALPPPYEKLGITQDILYKKTLLHEIRHCNEQQRRADSPINREADSEYTAIVKMGEVAGPRLRLDLTFLNYAYDFDVVHDVALYVSAHNQGKAPPSASEMLAANAAAKKLSPELLSRSFGRVFNVCAMPLLINGADIKKACNDKSLPELSPLTEKRAALKVAGMFHLSKAAPLTPTS